MPEFHHVGFAAIRVPINPAARDHGPWFENNGGTRAGVPRLQLASDLSQHYFPVVRLVPTATLTPMPRLPGLRSGCYGFTVAQPATRGKSIFRTVESPRSPAAPFAARADPRIARKPLVPVGPGSARPSCEKGSVIWLSRNSRKSATARRSPCSRALPRQTAGPCAAAR